MFLSGVLMDIEDYPQSFSEAWQQSNESHLTSIPKKNLRPRTSCGLKITLRKRLRKLLSDKPKHTLTYQQTLMKWHMPLNTRTGSSLVSLARMMVGVGH